MYRHKRMHSSDVGNRTSDGSDLLSDTSPLKHTLTMGGGSDEPYRRGSIFKLRQSKSADSDIGNAELTSLR